MTCFLEKKKGKRNLPRAAHPNRSRLPAKCRIWHSQTPPVEASVAVLNASPLIREDLVRRRFLSQRFIKQNRGSSREIEAVHGAEQRQPDGRDVVAAPLIGKA